MTSEAASAATTAKRVENCILRIGGVKGYFRKSVRKVGRDGMGWVDLRVLVKSEVKIGVKKYDLIIHGYIPWKSGSIIKLVFYRGLLTIKLYTGRTDIIGSVRQSET